MRSNEMDKNAALEFAERCRFGPAALPGWKYLAVGVSSPTRSPCCQHRGRESQSCDSEALQPPPVLVAQGHPERHSPCC